MSAISYVNTTAIPAALSLLPLKMDSTPARVMMLAIGLQESRFEHRVQVKGPAHGFWQFELGGVRGVLSHAASREAIHSVLDAMGYDTAPDTSYDALPDNDVLAAVYARLLLWTHPKPLPVQSNPDLAFKYYESLWRPGKPRPQSWPDCFETAWGICA